MARKLLAVLLLGMVLVEKVSSISLAANYKYYKSTGRNMVYDYTGSTRHGKLGGSYLVTDRGVSPYGNVYIDLMDYAFLVSDEYTVSSWVLNHQETSFIYLYLFHDSILGMKYIYTYHYFHSIGTTYSYAYDQISASTSIFTPPSNILGWNFHTVRIYKSVGPTSNVRINIELYINIAPLYSIYLDLSISTMTTAGMKISLNESIMNTGLILYETWIHLGFSAISDLNSLISTSCGCSNGCPTTPIITCLPTHGKFKNTPGDTCSIDCINTPLSCHTTDSTKCIEKIDWACRYRLYDLASLTCLFYCPQSSCYIYQDVDPITSLNVLNFDCEEGFDAIRTNPPACMNIRCLAYHPVGYKYVCDTTEIGYILDSDGECCTCHPDYTELNTYPLVCMNILHCIEYTQVDPLGYIFICLVCEEGYSVDAVGNCECDSNYVEVLDSPFTCALAIENCRDYIYDGQDYKCQACESGYLLDSQGACSECESGYFIYSQAPFVCVRPIEHCSILIYDGIKEVCEECDLGFRLDISGSRCDEVIEHCLTYIVLNNEEACTQCSDGYQLDADGNCNLCSTNYEKLSKSSSICVPKIENCSSYQKLDEDYICNQCSQGYNLDELGSCRLCSEHYAKDPESSLCIPSILNCLEYESSQETLKCTLCEQGYSIDLKDSCSECAQGYTSLPQDSSVCVNKIHKCLEYELYDGKGICTKCSKEYELDEENECKSCAEGYTASNTSTLECLLELSYDNQDQNSNSEIDEAQNDRGDKIAFYNSIFAIITLASVIIASVVSHDSNITVFYMNTIQLISLIQYLNINLPFEIKSQQGSTMKYIQECNVFSNIYVKDQELQDYSISMLQDYYSYISAAVYEMIIFSILILINMVIYAVFRYSKGKIKELSLKAFKYFRYTIYFQFYFIAYLDLVRYSLSKLAHVTYKQPKEDSILNLLDYNLSLISIVNTTKTLYTVSPFLLAILLMFINRSSDKERCLEYYGYLIKNNKESLFSLYYHVLFLIRRLSIPSAIQFVNDYPYIQVSICNLSCYIVIYN